MVFWGHHLLESYSCQQASVALSSAEAELHETVQGAARGLFVRNVLEVMLGAAPLVEVAADASAAIGVAQRLGAGRIRHLEAKELWIQEKVRCKQVAMTKIRSAANRADLLTKFLDVGQHHALMNTLPVAFATGCSLGRAVVACLVWAVPAQGTSEGVLELHGGLMLAARSCITSWLLSIVLVAVVACWWSQPKARRSTDASTQTTMATEFYDAVDS